MPHRRAWLLLPVALVAVAGVAETVGLIRNPDKQNPGKEAISPPVTVSRGSPFHTCGDIHSSVFENAEVEPSLAVNPARPGNVVVVYQQDRFADGAARGIVASASFDGGKSWTTATLPVGFCARAKLPRPFRTTDPWVSFGPDGRAYGLASNVAVVSTDGGKTWGSSVTLAEPTDAFLLDKGSLTADPTQKGVAYAIWARYRRTTFGPPTESDAMLAKTTDGGHSWSTPIIVTPHGHRAGPIASQIVVDAARNRLYHFAFWQAGVVPRADGSSRLILQSSVDGGTTWSRPSTIARVHTIGLGTTDPASGQRVRTGFVVPAIALEPRTGDLFVAWQDSSRTRDRFDQVLITHARAGGTTWAKPVVVNDPAKQAFDPTIAVNENGVVGIGYFEVPAGSDRNARTQYRFATTRDSGKSFVWRSIGESFLLNDAPMLTGTPELAAPPGLFLGDYMALQAVGGTFHIAMVTANHTPSNRTDVRYGQITLG